jgi:hypothetical protein
MEFGARTLARTVTPMTFLIINTSRRSASAASSAVAPVRCSTWTAISSIRPGLLRCSWKCGDSAGTRMMSSSIWVGNTLTPRRMIMSSVRPVIFCIRRMVRAVPGSSLVRSRVR